MAIQVALTGHLVIAQIAAADTAGAIYHFLELGVEPYMLGLVLEGVVSQRLARRICDNCKQKIKTEKKYLEKRNLPITPNEVFHEGRGCKICNKSGYKGRFAIYNILPSDPKIIDLLTQKPNLYKLRESIFELGYPNLTQDAVNAARKGKTSIEEALRAAAWK